jgi:hypothetical protein
LVKKRIIITEVDGEDKTVQPCSNKAIAANGRGRGRGRGRARRAAAGGGDDSDNADDDDDDEDAALASEAVAENFTFDISTGMPAGEDDSDTESDDDTEEERDDNGSDDANDVAGDGDGEGDGEGDAGGKDGKGEKKHPIKLAFKAMASAGVQQAIQPETYNIRSNFHVYLNKRLDAALNDSTPFIIIMVFITTPPRRQRQGGVFVVSDGLTSGSGASQYRPKTAFRLLVVRTFDLDTSINVI